MPVPEIEESYDVNRILSNVRKRHITHVDTPTGDALVLQFDVSYWDAENEMQVEGKFRYEVNFHSGSQWFFIRGDDGWDELWKNKRRY